MQFLIIVTAGLVVCVPVSLFFGAMVGRSNRLPRAVPRNDSPRPTVRIEAHVGPGYQAEDGTGP